MKRARKLGLSWITESDERQQHVHDTQIDTVVATTSSSSSFLQHSRRGRRQFWNTSFTPVFYG